MATVDVPLHWIVEYVVVHSDKFNAKFIQRIFVLEARVDDVM